MKLPSYHIASVRMRLTLWNVGALALVLAAFGAVLRYSVQANLLRGVDRDLSERTNRFVDGWNKMPEDRWRSLQKEFSKPRDHNASNLADIIRVPAGRRRTRPVRWGNRDPKRPAGPDLGVRFRPRILDLQGRPLLPGLADVPWDASPISVAATGKQIFTNIDIDNEPMRVLSAPLRRNNQIMGILQFASPLTELQRDVDGLSNTLLMLIPVALLVAGVTGAYLTDRALRPVRQITQAAAQTGVENLSQRLPCTGADEFANLAATFNAMLGRLERAFEQQRRFTADASHELRTPLTVIKANTSLALSGERTAAEYRRALAAADRAANLTGKIVQDLLLLARSDSGQLMLDIRLTPIREVLEASLESFVGRERVSITLEAPEHLSVLGDSTHLIRLFTNLLDNAVRHTPEDGTIRILTSYDDLTVTVTVSDTGAGIAPEHLPHVCERFYRIDPARARARGGTGLGLAICQSIVEAHQGVLTIESTLGKGTNVRVLLLRAVPTTNIKS